ncbi:hypothetical protein [Sinanaerobacter sp. ZZT-01]|uniref:hypothetical protein n=1 Tax=Sinanaerobacter sp. ZZT-01 TaxID=3111540 RepID=UPI002D79FFE6|nr:hypothetical protein [Sinanaerobacter sp. ZZT-01]WRR92848.1 hypothetical protein U5921_12510 [Sinanaerobacter sp. ZZT-01]
MINQIGWINQTEDMNQTTQNENYLTYDQVNIIIAFQKLWLDLASWMRSYIKAEIYDTKNLQSVKNYLLTLPSEFYDTFSIFYGTIPAQRIMDLMSEFIKSGMKVVESLKYGDSLLADSRTIEWYKIADDLSSFLARTNIYWDENQWKYLLYQYIKLKIEEINAIINDNYEEEIKLYNSIEDIVFLMASYMARGIISSNLKNI